MEYQQITVSRCSHVMSTNSTIMADHEDAQPLAITNKRTASSPPMMEGEAKRQPRTDYLNPISLESDTDHSESEEQENTTLTPGSDQSDQPLHTDTALNKPPTDNNITLATVNDKVDRVLLCLEKIDKRVEKNANKCRKKFLNIQKAHNDVVGSINSLNDRANSADDFNEETRAMVRECLQKVSELALRSDLRDQSSNTRLESVEKSIIELGTEVKEKKLIISGVKEEKGENIRQVALKSLKKALSIAKAAQENDDYEGTTFAADPSQLSLSSLDQVYRIGSKSASWSSRNILVSFKDSYHRYILLRTKPFLADSQEVTFYLEEDMTPTTRTHRSKLKMIATAAKNENMEVKLTGNRISIEGATFGINDLDTIPSNLVKKSKQEKNVEDGLAYRGPESIFSNFYPAAFDVEGTRFNSVEQFYQHSKAIACKNYSRASKILWCTDPRRIKELGEGLEFNQDWLPNRVPTLYAGTHAKFHQNPDLADTLLSTGDINLYEATTDPYFGCGISFQSKKWATKEWSGENVAGRILMKVRAELSGLHSSSSTGNEDYLVGLDDTSGADPSLNPQLEKSVNTSGVDNHPTPSGGNAPQEKNQNGGKGTNHKNYGKQRNFRRNKGRGRGRGSWIAPRASSDTKDRSPNVTGRSARRQSAYKQLSDRDQDFLNGKNYHASMEITTSTPKADNNIATKHLSDSELQAMGIDPTSDYAADVRRKYSLSETGV